MGLLRTQRRNGEVQEASAESQQALEALQRNSGGFLLVGPLDHSFLMTSHACQPQPCGA